VVGTIHRTPNEPREAYPLVQGPGILHPGHFFSLGYSIERGLNAAPSTSSLGLKPLLWRSRSAGRRRFTFERKRASDERALRIAALVNVELLVPIAAGGFTRPRARLEIGQGCHALGVGRRSPAVAVFCQGHGRRLRPCSYCEDSSCSRVPACSARRYPASCSCRRCSR
jgi:hypothetical protein